MQSDVKKNTEALFINQHAAALTAILYHAVLVYVPELYTLLSLEWQTGIVSLSSLVHVNFAYWLLQCDCWDTTREVGRGGFDPNKKINHYSQLVWNQHDAIDFTPKSTLITECGVNLTDLLKDIAGSDSPELCQCVLKALSLVDPHGNLSQAN